MTTVGAASVGEVSQAGFFDAIKATISFYRCMLYFIRGSSYKACPFFADKLQARIQCYSLALIFYLWSQPHYRNSSFRDDMSKNLRNVAVPGSGIPISTFCLFKGSAYLFVLAVNPILCFLAAVNAQRKHSREVTELLAPRTASSSRFVVHLEKIFHPDKRRAVLHHYTGTTYPLRNSQHSRQGIRRSYSPWAQAFIEQLLCPQDWFSFWRLNCRLASYHALVTKSMGYKQEDKWTFLRDGKSIGVPISPFLDVPAVVIKDKNEEGGMGLYFFKNATEGGDWIIQERLYNDDFVSSLLPENAPLSTMRIISASRSWLEERKGNKPGPESIECLSCVFRAGRQGADTDHSSILFDVDMSSGTILKGTTNAHWYQLGVRKAFSTQWLSAHDTTHHPDNDKLKVSGAVIPGIESTLALVADAHFRLMPDVPLVGWDVALTTKGVCLLEVNLSCNFFRGSFDVPHYVHFVHDYFVALEEERATRDKVE